MIKPSTCVPMVDDDGQWSCPAAGSPECERCPIRLTMRRPPTLRHDPPAQPAPATPVQALPILERRLRKLAESVRSIGAGYGRHDNPERILLAKQEIAAQLEQLAAMVAGGRP